MFTGNNFADILRFISAKLPKQTAIKSEDGKEISFEELNFRVNALANGLRNLGIKYQEKLVSLLPNSIEAAEVVFATAKMWIISIPINPHLNPREVEVLLEHSEAQVLIVHSMFIKLIENISKSVLKKFILIWLDEEKNNELISYHELVEKNSRIEIDLEVNDSTICNIIYTSGTTGKPKGVIRTHRNNTYAAINMALSAHYSQNDSELIVMPLWSIAFFNIFAPNILMGSTVVLKEIFDPVSILKTIENEKINRIYLVPFMWKTLIGLDGLNEFDLDSITQICTGSAPISIRTKMQLFEKFPRANIREVWGMTEGGIIGFRSHDALHKPDSFGMPIPFNKSRVVDKNGFDLPPGKVGELVVYGPSVCVGYYRDPEETAKRFDSDGWFHTRDLVKMDEDGYFYISGRMSDLIISDGNKIYPQEIEDTIRMHPHINECIVFGKDDNKSGEIIVTVVSVEGKSQIEEDELRDFIKKYLSNYKIPKIIHLTESLPKTLTGKLKKAEIIKLYTM